MELPALMKRAPSTKFHGSFVHCIKIMLLAQRSLFQV